MASFKTKLNENSRFAHMVNVSLLVVMWNGESCRAGRCLFGDGKWRKKLESRNFNLKCSCYNFNLLSSWVHDRPNAPHTRHNSFDPKTKPNNFNQITLNNPFLLILKLLIPQLHPAFELNKHHRPMNNLREMNFLNRIFYRARSSDSTAVIHLFLLLSVS